MVGSRTRVKVVKNKVAPPFKEAEFDILYGIGISKAGTILDMAVEADIINKSGAWYSYGEVRLGQGRENAKDYLTEHPELADELEMKVRTAKGLVKAEEVQGVETESEREQG
jgi:recombination protein RecA